MKNNYIMLIIMFCEIFIQNSAMALQLNLGCMLTLQDVGKSDSEFERKFCTDAKSFYVKKPIFVDSILSSLFVTHFIICLLL
jgi:hypothetical protein